jgi:hypothetical protein
MLTGLSLRLMKVRAIHRRCIQKWCVMTAVNVILASITYAGSRHKVSAQSDAADARRRRR